MTSPASPAMDRYGIKVTLPRGWDGTIFRRQPGHGDNTHPVLHTATFPLPTIRGDFGSGAVEQMTSTDVLLALVESDPASAVRPLFASNSRPKRLTRSDFSADSLQHPIPGHVGSQRFFAENSRAFCLYVVLGSAFRGQFLLPMVNQVVQGLELSSPGP